MEAVLSTDEYNLILQNITDPNPEMRTVTLLWFMQVNKACEHTVREYFKRRNRKPIELLTSGEIMKQSLGIITGNFDDRVCEFRYGSLIKSTKRANNDSGVLTYNLVHERVVVNISLIFDETRKCELIEYANPNYTYRITMYDEKPKLFERTSRQDWVKYTMNITGDQEPVLFKTTTAFGRLIKLPELSNFQAVVSDIGDKVEFVFKMIPQAKDELYR